MAGEKKSGSSRESVTATPSALPPGSEPSALLPSDVLEAAAKLIEPEGAWTQGWFAKDRFGENKPSWSPEAACWCLVGSVRRISDGDYITHAPFVERAVAREDAAAWNDHPDRTQAEVVKALRDAAHLARREGR